MCGKLAETVNCADSGFFFAKNGGDGKKGVSNNMFTNTVDDGRGFAVYF